MASPFFVIQRQEALAYEQFSKNEVIKRISVVSKNHPFSIDVSSSMNLHHARIVARLYYDDDSTFQIEQGSLPSSFQDLKAVDSVKKEPMVYKTFISESGDRATIELRVFVLTSQHEDSLFRVKIGVEDSHSGLSMEVISEPIRIVSKPAQAHKPMYKNPQGTSKKGPSNSISCASLPAFEPAVGVVQPSARSSSSVPISRVNSTDGTVCEVLARLEQQQIEQKALLQNIISHLGQKRNRQDDEDEIMRNFMSTVSHFEEGSSCKPSITESPKEEEFDNALLQFLSVFRRVPCHERSSKMRKIISHLRDEDEFAFEAAVQQENVDRVTSIYSPPSEIDLLLSSSSDELIF